MDPFTENWSKIILIINQSQVKFSAPASQTREFPVILIITIYLDVVVRMINRNNIWWNKKLNNKDTVPVLSVFMTRDESHPASLLLTNIIKQTKSMIDE